MVVLFLSYLASILLPFLRRSPSAPGRSGDFAWHLFVPCRDEEAVIDRTLRNVREAFPFCHIWVIDDASEDGTADVVARHGLADERVHLVRRILPDARTGKGDALNAAYERLDRFLPPGTDRSKVIVGVLDADGQLAPDALDYVAAPEVFGDPAVGGAQISVWMRNRDEPHPRWDRGPLYNSFCRLLVRMQDLEFRTTIAAMQMLRSRTGSVGLGGNGQFTRLSVLDTIAATQQRPWHGALLEDYELGLHILLAGYQNRYVHDTHVSQEGLPQMRRLLVQRTRWSQGNMQCCRYLPAIVRSKHFSSAGVLEAGYFLLLPFIQLAGAVVWPVVFATILRQFLESPQSALPWLLQSWWLIGMLLLLGVLPFAIWGPIYRRQCAPEATFTTSLGWGLAHWLYVYYMYVSVVYAFIRLLLGRSGWAKTRRNAERVVSGPIAKEA